LLKKPRRKRLSNPRKVRRRRRRRRLLLGVSAVSLVRYGVMPDDDVYTAIKVLDKTAPHLAKLLRSVLNGDGAS
jgi:hypothetical protein